MQSVKNSKMSGKPNQILTPAVAETPEGISGQGFFATSIEKAVGLARKNSLWPLPFATSCCGIEFMATMGAHYDLARDVMIRTVSLDCDQWQNYSCWLAKVLIGGGSSFTVSGSREQSKNCCRWAAFI